VDKEEEEEKRGRRLEAGRACSTSIQQSFLSAVFICIKLVMTFQVSLRLKCLLDHFEQSLLVHVALLTWKGSF
jgi:hypothetical protein